jgi:hypothetical protein
VIDHSQPLLAQLQALGVPELEYVASLTHTEQHFAQLIDVLKPQGRLGVIDDPESLDVMPLKRKSLALRNPGHDQPASPAQSGQQSD